MKKIFIVAIAAVMLFSIVIIPAYAYDEYNYYGDKYYSTILEDDTGLASNFLMAELDGANIILVKMYVGDIGADKLMISPEIKAVNIDGEVKVQLNMYESYNYNRDTQKWIFASVSEETYTLPASMVKWAYDTIYFDDNSVFMQGNPNFENSSQTECDGSTCPATDANYDNVCDDCGKPLTMSLRNTLYDYALYLAESKVTDGYNYYAIFKSSDTYYVHISKAPMTSPDGTTLEGDGIMYNRVTQSADGTNGGSGWYNGFYSSYDEFVEANHTISNFKGALPLAVKILGVAGEQITLKLPTLVGLMMTLLACGVGCLALLVVLKLFGKRSLISRK